MLVLIPSVLEFGALFPELSSGDAASGGLTWSSRSARHEVALVGVGLAAAGARAGVLMARSREEGVLLTGLAGTFDESRLGLGDLVLADRLELDGVGVGSGGSLERLQDAAGPLAAECDSAAPLIPMALPCEGPVSAGLVSVCAASADAAEAGRRRARYPACLAEDMESWAVARAALAAGKSLSVLRGVSNVVGDRDHAGWRIREALEGLREILHGLADRADGGSGA